MSAPSKQPWRRLRDMEPPLGSKRRVILNAQAQAQIVPGPSRRWLLVPTFALAIAGFWFLMSTSEDVPVASQSVATQPVATESVAATTKLGQQAPLTSEPIVEAPLPAQLSVTKDDELVIRLPKARLRVVGPAAVTTTAKGIRITEGRVEVAGFAVISAPNCDVSVNGDAIASIVGANLEVKVNAGRATSSNPACVITYAAVLTTGTAEAALEAEGKIDEPETKANFEAESSELETKTELEAKSRELETKAEVETSKTDNQIEWETDEPKTKQPITAQPSSLRQQLEAYKQARELKTTQPASSLRDLESFVKTWPTSLLCEEAEATIVELLMRLHRDDEAKSKLRAFTTSYPASAHTQRLLRIVEEAP